MSEEEKREQVESEEQGSSEGSDAAAAPAEGSEESAAGPVAEEGSSSSQAAGEDPSSPPPAEEASEDSEPEAEEAEAPAEDAAAAEEPAADSSSEEAEAPADEEASTEAEAPAAAASPEDELPWKEKRRLQRSRLPHQPKPQQTPEERKVARAEARKAKATLRRTQRAAAKTEKSGGVGTPQAEPTPNAAKVRQGVVVSSKGEKSITVRIDFARRHPTYEKIVRRSRTLHAHDERNEAGEGDTVRVVETRPLSKTKRWRLVEIMEKAK
jgi:small subunit ribosomal protein S17